jgi:hypothetical protein
VGNHALIRRRRLRGTIRHETIMSLIERFSILSLAVIPLLEPHMAVSAALPDVSCERMFEATFESKKSYADSFNDVDVDVVFEGDGQSWRIPAFWRGDGRWTVRFAPPAPGQYIYRLQSTDGRNPDLNGHAGRVMIAPYAGDNALLRHGAPRVSQNHRYFEHADGTPFYWLGDTWWTNLSDRLPWEGFQRLTADRVAKGFTVIQIAAGLVPSNEEHAPSDPGFCNEGGCVWEADFARINPKYFDYADRRIQYLVDHGLTPAIVGGWRQVLAQMGIHKMKQQWRYIIARYGAYPVFWIAGGETYDPPPAERQKWAALASEVVGDVPKPGDWTEIVRYIRRTDPYHHPLSVHEIDPPFDNPIQDESLTDFDFFQSGHRGWPSVDTEIAQLNKHYARTSTTKPLVESEIGHERTGAEGYENFQRAAFWLAMLNGAAGFSYGNLPTAEAYSAAKPFHRSLVSLYNWEEGMRFPGATEVAMGAKLLRQHSWWKITPHPEWVQPHGTTLLEPNAQVNGFDIDLIAALERKPPPPDGDLPLGEWHKRHGTWRLPYAAGIPKELRLVYLPNFGMKDYLSPTIKGLEPGVSYRVYYWDPALGIKVNLGAVRRGTAAGDPDRLEPPTERKLYDATGEYRGELKGSGWDAYGTHGKLEDDTYTPEPPPTMGDWLLVLDAQV